MEWFLRYKSYEGKKAKNRYASDYMKISRKDTIKIIEETHAHWVEELKNKSFVFPSSP